MKKSPNRNKLKNKLALALLITSALPVNLDAIGHAQEKEEDLTTITISANPLAPSIVEYGKAASIMRKDEIQQRSSSTLGETIGLEPGVSSSFFGQGASRPVIRGFSGNRVRILKNGVSTGDVSDLSEDHVVTADPLQAKQIEILRGPATLLYGSSAIGGSVNVTDDSIPEEALGKPFAGEVIGQLGDSADNEKTAGVKLKGEIESFNWNLSAFSRETAAYEIPGFAESSRLMELEEKEHDVASEEDHGEEDHEEERAKGKVLNSDTDTWGGTMGGSHIWDDGFIGLSISKFDSNYGIPGHSHSDEDHSEELLDEHSEDEHGEEQLHEDSVRIDADELRVDFRGRFDKVSDSINAIKFRLGVTDYEHKETEGGETGTKFERNTADGRVEFIHNDTANHKGAVGVQMFYDDFSAVGDEAFLVPTKTFAPALFAFEQLGLSADVDLEFGGRVESVKHEPVGIDSESFVPVSLSTGPVWDLNGNGDYNIGLTFGYSERAPSAVELFADGAHLARQIIERGNSSLDIENSFGVDLAIRKNTGFLRSVLTPFYQDFSNYINLASTGEEDEGLPVYAYQEVDAKFWGFEFQNALHFEEIADLGVPTLKLEHQIDYVRARNDSFSEDLPRTPPLRNIVRLKSDLSESLEAMVEGVFVAEQNDTTEFEIPTENYALLNTQIAFKIPTSEESGLKFFVKGSNLTDEEARVHSSFLKDLAPLRGRAFVFGVSGNF